MRFQMAIAVLALSCSCALAAQAQDTGGYYGGGQDQGGYYDPGYQDPGQGTDPGYGAQPQPQPQPQPAAQPAAQPASAGFSVSTEGATAEADGEEISGFELGINWGGGAKLAIEPGWCFGRVGLYLLFGLGYQKIHEEASTDDTELNDPTNPAAGAAHHAANGDWDEEVTIDTSGLNYDVGLGLRIYLLEPLKARSPNLYLELGLGWRGAAYKTEVDWNWTGDDNAIDSSIGDVNGDGDVDDADAEALEFGVNKLANQTAEDVNDDAEEYYDGVWWNLGLGGEYVFPGGFGIAGEAGLSFFMNTPWTPKAPFGYDDDGDIDDFDWEYEDVEYKGWVFELGFYYSVAFRYHF